MNATQEVTFTEPQYIVLFRTRQQDVTGYRPIVSERETLQNYLDGRVTLPLGLDRDFEPVLPALWYCLHLPRSRFDFDALGPRQLKTLQTLNLPHSVTFVPFPYPGWVPTRLAGDNPKLVLAPDELLGAANALASQLEGVVDVAALSTLQSDRLASDWQALHRALRVQRVQYVQPSELIVQRSIRSIVMPTHLLIRQLEGGRDSQLPPPHTTREVAVATSLELQARLSAMERLERDGRAPEATRDSFLAVLAEERERFTCPVAIALRGVSAVSQGSKLRRKLQRQGRLREDDADLEHEALEVAVAHRALCRSGLSLGTVVVPDEAFRNLDELERAWARAAPTPKAVQRLLGRMTRAAAHGFDAPTVAALHHATWVTCFSEFPLGLLSLPYDTEPIGSRVPIAYRPIVPLTRCLQMEMMNLPSIDLSRELSILVAECLGADHLVGRLSRSGWEIGLKNLERTPNVRSRFVEVLNVPHLRRVLQEERYDAVVISAHGYVDPGRGQAGFICGGERVGGDELERMPPVVCLSACQVTPRGGGTVNVTDLLFRAGARVVFGPLVPVDVRRNAILMTRFFVYLSETLRGETGMKTLQDVWHHTVVTNTVNDVLRATDALDHWAHEEPREESVIWEFMHHRANGRLRAGHIYADTIAVLEDIAEDRGKGEWFRSTIRSHGFLPESLFYIMLGWPEQVIVHDPAREEARRKYEPFLPPRVRAARQGVR